MSSSSVFGTFSDKRTKTRLRDRRARGDLHRPPRYGRVFMGMVLTAVGIVLLMVGFNAEGDQQPWAYGLGGLIALVCSGAIFAVVAVAGAQRTKLKVHARYHPDEQWMQDHMWSRERSSDLTMRQASHLMVGTAAGIIIGGPLLGAGVGMLVANMQVGWLFVAAGAVSVGGGLYGLAQVFILLYRRFRFGRTHVEFGRFPFWTDERIELRWVCPGIDAVRRLRFTLRLIEEEVHIKRVDRSRVEEWQLYERYSDAFELDDPGALPAGKPVRVVFQLPAGAPGTKLRDTEPRYWELEVVAEKLGVNFRGRYLLPIYERRA